MTDRAVKITEKSMEVVTRANGGEPPQKVGRVSYFIKSDKPGVEPLVLPQHIFRKNFEFIEEESDTTMSRVREREL